MKETIWSDNDPREELSGLKRVPLVIAVPITHNCYETVMAFAEMKNDWCIFLSWPKEMKDRRSFISADEPWPDHWLWLAAP